SEIRRAAGRRAVVLVARHPTAPLPLPSGVTWRLRDGAVDTRPRDGDRVAAPAGLMEVETGDGVMRLVDEAELPAVLRAALEAGQAIRRVQPARDADSDVAGDDPAEVTGAAPRRAGAVYRVLYGAAHRARLLALIERAGWRLLTAVAVFLVLFVVRNTPMAPLLKLSTHPTTLQTPVGGPAAWLFLPGLALVAVAAFLATRRVSA